MDASHRSIVAALNGGMEVTQEEVDAMYADAKVDDAGNIDSDILYGMLIRWHMLRTIFVHNSIVQFCSTISHRKYNRCTYIVRSRYLSYPIEHDDSFIGCGCCGGKTKVSQS